MGMLLFFILLLGTAVGAVSALLGLGGGIFMVPLMPWLFGFSVHEAVATSLFAVFLVSGTNTYKYSRQSLVVWPVGLLLGVPAAVVALFVGYFSVQISGWVIESFLLAILIVLAIKTLFASHSLNDDPADELTTKKKGYMLSAGLVSGLISGLTGVGSGLIMTPMMILLRLVRARELAPTSNLSMFLTTGAAVTGYLWVQRGGQVYVHYKYGVALFAVAFVSSAFFRARQQKLDGKTKAVALSVILIAMIVKVSLSVIGGQL